ARPGAATPRRAPGSARGGPAVAEAPRPPPLDPRLARRLVDEHHPARTGARIHEPRGDDEADPADPAGLHEDPARPGSSPRDERDARITRHDAADPREQRHAGRGAAAR